MNSRLAQESATQNERAWDDRQGQRFGWGSLWAGGHYER